MNRTTLPSVYGLLLLAGLLILLSNCSILPGLSPESAMEASLQLHVIDVGYGESLLLRFSDGTTLLWDAGYPEQAGNVIAYLRTHGVEHISLAVNSHPHPDHIGGFPALLAAIPVDNVAGAFPPDHESVPDSFREALRQNDIPYHILRKGDTQRIGTCGNMTVLNPGELVPDLNDSSMAALITLGTTRILLTADIGPVAQRRMIEENPDLLPAHVMTVPHHGGRSHLAFFDAVNPRFATLSVGPNPWGNPKKETIEYLQSLEDKNKLAFFRTDEDGPIVIECNDRGSCNVRKTQ